MIGYIDEKRIDKLSGNDEVPLYQKIIKLSEEAGECSQAFLKYDKSVNVSASAKGTPLDVIEESCDCINVAMDIINSFVKIHPELEEPTRELFQAKLDKWERKQQKVNNDNSI